MQGARRVCETIRCVKPTEALQLRTQAVFRRAGFALVRVHRHPGKDQYEPAPTCQIPALANLYRLYFGEPSTERTVVEVGAFDGYTYSNTWQLAQLGWRTVLFEPVPAHAEMCRQRYQACDNVSVHEVAVGADRSEITMRVGGEYSTADTSTAATYEGISYAAGKLTEATIRVEQAPLDELLDPILGEDTEIDLLVVDVEGYETDVFAGFDLPRRRPKMIIVELTDTHPLYSHSRPSSAQLAMNILDAGYVVVSKDMGNTVYVERSHYEHVSLGAF